MSKTFTSRPSQVSSRGRGRGDVKARSQNKSQQAVRVDGTNNARLLTSGGRGVNRSPVAARGRGSRGRPVGPPGINPRKTKMSSEPMEGSSSDTSEQAQTSQATGYTVISPNERRRQQITQQAKKEEDAYAAHQKQKSVQSYSYVGTVGGEASSEEQARIRQSQVHRAAKLTNLEKQREWRKQAKQKEQEEIEQRLSKARSQAERNEERKQFEAESMSGKWDEDRRRKNEEFLSRLERHAPVANSSVERHAPVANTNVERHAPVANSNVEEQKRKSPKEVKASADTAQSVSDVSHPTFGRRERDSGWTAEQRNETESNRSATNESETTGDGNPLEGKNADQMDVILTLQDMFPQYNLDYLTDIAEQSQYSLEASAALLAD